VLFLLILGAAGLVTAPEAFAAALGRDVGFADYATLAWFVAWLATIGGALGSALESEDAVRSAAYPSSDAEERAPEESSAVVNP
jgi:hypothetical protein